MYIHLSYNSIEVRLMITFIEYPKCSTCKKAKQYLDTLNINYTSRHILEEKLNENELKALYKKSGLPLKRFFNTSGNKYKELNLKDKLPLMSESEQLALLATDGMLVKRPIVVSDDKIIVGFKMDEYEYLSK